MTYRAHVKINIYFCICIMTLFYGKANCTFAGSKMFTIAFARCHRAPTHNNSSNDGFEADFAFADKTLLMHNCSLYTSMRVFVGFVQAVFLPWGLFLGSMYRNRSDILPTPVCKRNPVSSLPILGPCTKYACPVIATFWQ